MTFISFAVSCMSRDYLPLCRILSWPRAEFYPERTSLPSKTFSLLSVFYQDSNLTNLLRDSKLDPVRDMSHTPKGRIKCFYCLHFNGPVKITIDSDWYVGAWRRKNESLNERMGKQLNFA